MVKEKRNRSSHQVEKVKKQKFAGIDMVMTTGFNRSVGPLGMGRRAAGSKKTGFKDSRVQGFEG